MPVKKQQHKRGLDQWFRSQSRSATKHDLRKAVEQIMSKISEFSERQSAFNARQDAAIDGLVSDVKTLNDKITELQNTPGEITPADQALLDELEARSKVIVEKVEALDAQTPPAPPA